jgi:hypothetical protein
VRVMSNTMLGLIQAVFQPIAVEHLMRVHINHVSKLEFLYTFRDAFFVLMIEKNIQRSFVGASLVPYDPKRVLSKLDVKLHTPIPQNSHAGTLQSWVF